MLRLCNAGCSAGFQRSKGTPPCQLSIYPHAQQLWACQACKAMGWVQDFIDWVKAALTLQL